MLEAKPAKTSSIVIPRPPCIFSADLINNGFQISNNLNKIIPINRLGIENGINSMVTKIPATSSITTHCGSFELKILIA